MVINFDICSKTYQKSSAVKTIFVKTINTSGVFSIVAWLALVTVFVNTIYTSGVFSIVAWLALVTVFVNTIYTTIFISLLFGFLTLDNFILVPLCEGTVR